MKSKSLTPCRDKLERISEFKIVPVPQKMQARFGISKMLIPKPLDIESLIRKIPFNKLVTRSELRRKLSEEFSADVTCALTTGIFLKIIAEASEEDSSNGVKNPAPYWRVISDDGSLNEKYPGGTERHRLYLEKEGHTFEILKNGKKIKIDNFTEKLFKF